MIPPESLTLPTYLSILFVSILGVGGSGEVFIAPPIVPLPLINDEDVPLRRAFEDLVQYDGLKFAQQHKINGMSMKSEIVLLIL